MKIIGISGRGFASNTYLLISGQSAFVIDPSASAESIISAAKAEDAKLYGMLLTHGHFDHTMTLKELKKELNIPIYIHRDDNEMLTDGKKDAYYTFFGSENLNPPADILLSDGDELSLGNEKIKVIGAKGHTKGSVLYRCGDTLISGDTLFAEGYGRCDLYGGSFTDIQKTLKKMEGLPSTLTIYPGHGASENIRTALDRIKHLF